MLVWLGRQTGSSATQTQRGRCKCRLVSFMPIAPFSQRGAPPLTRSAHCWRQAVGSLYGRRTGAPGSFLCFFSVVPSCYSWRGPPLGGQQKLVEAHRASRLQLANWASSAHLLEVRGPQPSAAFGEPWTSAVKESASIQEAWTIPAPLSTSLSRMSLFSRLPPRLTPDIFLLSSALPSGANTAARNGWCSPAHHEPRAPHPWSLKLKCPSARVSAATDGHLSIRAPFDTGFR